MITFSRLQHTLWQIIIVGLIVLNFYILKSPALGLILALIYLWLNSKKIADIFFAALHKGLRKTLGLLLILAYISLAYTLVYHLYRINDYIFWWLIISVPLALEILSYRTNTPHYFLQDVRWPRLADLRQLIWPLLFLISDLLILILLFRQASTGVIRSPWELLSDKFWALFIVSNFCLAVTFVSRKSSKNLWLIIFHFFILASLAVILYPLGYGYDSFIHLAGLRTISETGTIEPRLFLYMGQYGLTLFAHSLTQLPLELTNKLLLPTLFALLWPSGLFSGLKYGFNWPFKSSYLSVLWSLFIGFSFFIMTTPQGLAFLLVAFYFFILPLVNKKEVSLYLLWLIAVMAMVIHPLGGISLIFFSLIKTISRLPRYRRLRSALICLAIILACASLPIFFYAYEVQSGVPASRIFNIHFWPIFDIPDFYWWQTFSFPADLIHNVGQNQIWLYASAVISGLILILVNNKQIFFKRLLTFLVILIFNYLLAKILLAFSLNIGYQKDDYLQRIIYMVGLACLPIFLTTFYFASRHALTENSVWPKVWLVLITTLVVSVSTYFSYPVYDKYQNDKSFNVTATDIKTVETIKDLAGEDPYIVLANQMVGAAAIAKYDFARYYNGNFYYSVPLGTDNIYQNYLTMIEKNASRAEALRAMDKAGVNKLYFVVNNYWHSAKQAITQASQTADEKILIDNGVNTVFVYNRR
ncbi:MAG: hypothetical protein C3F02_04920 [Parcubacteria group bacterium]|nr:MAG: hypothetical protein C3F02_04920 [Parcubacteria group bacterium]